MQNCEDLVDSEPTINAFNKGKISKQPPISREEKSKTCTVMNDGPMWAKLG